MHYYYTMFLRGLPFLFFCFPLQRPKMETSVQRKRIDDIWSEIFCMIKYSHILFNSWFIVGDYLVFHWYTVIILAAMNNTNITSFLNVGIFLTSHRFKRIISGCSTGVSNSFVAEARSDINGMLLGRAICAIKCLENQWPGCNRPLCFFGCNRPCAFAHGHNSKPLAAMERAEPRWRSRENRTTDSNRQHDSNNSRWAQCHCSIEACQKFKHPTKGSFFPPPCTNRLRKAFSYWCAHSPEPAYSFLVP